MHAFHSTRRLRFGASPLAAALLVLALWFASTLGLVHGVVHVTGVPSALSAPSAPAISQAAEQGTTASLVARSVAKVSGAAAISGLAALFTDHADGDAQCRLYDQLCHGPTAIAVPLIVLPLLLPTATFDFFQGEVLARWVALFQARGPPFSC